MFLCDGQGAEREAILYADRSCYKFTEAHGLQTELSTCTFLLPVSGDFCGQPVVVN